jgi:hypothetical protein
MRKITDNILFIIGLLVIAFILLFFSNAYAANVTDNNRGTNGYILVNNGTGQGHQGTWTDPNNLPAIVDLNKALNTEIDDRLFGDKTLQTNLDTEINKRTNADNSLQNNINTVDTNSKGRDTALQNNIDTEANTRSSADTSLQSNISNVDDKQTSWNNKQDTSISSINKINDRQDTSINNLNNAVDNLDNRVNKLEQTQYVAEAEFRVFDSKRLTIKPFIRQNFTRSKLDTVGVRFTIKLGESYEEKEIAKTNVKVDNINSRLVAIEKRLGQPAYIEKTIIKDNKGRTTKTSIHITEVPAVFAVKGEF